MCGQRALEYVRYRHTDNDIVRGARQQDFLRQVRAQVTASKLLGQDRQADRHLRRQHPLDIQSSRRAAAPAADDAGGAGQADQAGEVPRPAGRVLRDRQPRADQGGRAPVPVPAAGEGPARASNRKRSKPAAQGQLGRRKGEADRRHGRRAASRASSPRTARRVPGLLPAQAGAGLLVSPRTPRAPTRSPAPTTGATAPTRWWSSPASSASTTACRAPPGAIRRSSSTPSEKRTIRGREYLLFYNGDRLRLVGWKTDRGALLDLEHPAPDRSPRRRCWEWRARCRGPGDQGAAEPADNLRACLRDRPIGVIGVGWVGLVSAACFAELGHDVWCRDIDAAEDRGAARRPRARSTSPASRTWSRATPSGCTSSSTLAPLLEHARLLFVCVDTPPTYSGDADLSRVEAVIEELPSSAEHAIVMKSTVPVGTGANVRRRLGGARQGRARLRLESRVPEGGLGGRGLHATRTASWSARTRARPGPRTTVARLYEPLDCPVVRTDVASAEMIKLASNAFLATKISFINEIANVCEEVGADVGRGRARHGPRPAHRRQLPERRASASAARASRRTSRR